MLSAAAALPLLALAGCSAGIDIASEREAARAADSLRSLPPLKKRPGGPSSQLESGVRPAFRDVAAQVGVEFTFHSDTVEGRWFLPEIMGGGVGCLDYDRDGWIDLFFPNGSWLIPQPAQSGSPPRNAFFRNQGGVWFDEIAATVSLDDPGYGQGCAAADYDADGFADLYLTNYGDNVLYRNNGDGTFSPVESDVLKGSQRWSTSAAWADVNLDGWLDLYVVNYLTVTERNLRSCDYNGITGYCGPGEFDALPDEVFVNLGNGEFEEGAERLGLVAPNGKGLAISVLDFDNDLRPEIYVANDMTENFLFTRTDLTGSAAGSASGESRYQNLAYVSGCAVSESGMNEASMGIACADFDLDQLPDIYLTHFYHQKNTLYHNRGRLTFYDDSRRFRVTAHSHDYLGFGVVPLDYDSSGTTDLFVANGHVLGRNYPAFEMQPQLLANPAGNGFEDVSPLAGGYFTRKYLGRGAAGVDFDNDGDTDLVVSHLDEPAAVLSNETPQGDARAVGLILEDRHRNCPIGGRVEIVSDGYRRTYPVGSGGSYLSSPDPRLLIPLPRETERAFLLRIWWTSGEVSEYTDLAPGRYWTVREGFAPMVLAEFAGTPRLLDESGKHDGGAQGR